MTSVDKRYVFPQDEVYKYFSSLVVKPNINQIDRYDGTFKDFERAKKKYKLQLSIFKAIEEIFGNNHMNSIGEINSNLDIALLEFSIHLRKETIEKIKNEMSKHLIKRFDSWKREVHC